jgi:hypothetical protein
MVRFFSGRFKRSGRVLKAGVEGATQGLNGLPPIRKVDWSPNIGRGGSVLRDRAQIGIVGAKSAVRILKISEVCVRGLYGAHLAAYILQCAFPNIKIDGACFA